MVLECIHGKMVKYMKDIFFMDIKMEWANIKIKMELFFKVIGKTDKGKVLGKFLFKIRNQFNGNGKKTLQFGKDD